MSQHYSYQRELTKEQRYTYNGKESITDLDLGWLDFGARMYQADLGRWFNVDPMAEKYLDMTPYKYGLNNPVAYTDPTGMTEVYGVEMDLAATGSVTPVFDASPDVVENGTRYESMDDFIEQATMDYYAGLQESMSSSNTNGGSQDLIDVTDKFYNQMIYTGTFFHRAAANIEALAAEEGWSALQIRKTKLDFFKSQVGTGAPFDIKQRGKGFSPAEIGEKAIFEGSIYSYDDFGNINYGYAAKSFGLTLFEALAGAGYNQTVQTRTPDFSNPIGFFDHRRDTKMIIQGFYFRIP